MTWEEWSLKHAAAFGLFELKDGVMMSEWVAVLKGEGFTPDELAEATVWIAAHDAPRFRNEHLARLTDFVRQSRLRARNAQETACRRAAEPAACAPSCEACAGTGLVLGLTVVQRAGLRKRERSVACRCPAGVRLFMARLEAGYPLLSLDEVERTDPGWRERGPGARAEEPASGLGAMVERIIAGAKARGV